MSKRATRKRVAPKDGRRFSGGWRTDYTDGCEAADKEHKGDNSLIPISGIVKASVIPFDPPVLEPMNPYTVTDENGSKHYVQAKGETARRNGLASQAYFAARDKLTLERLREIQANAYGVEHRVKADPMCRSHAFYAGLSKRRKELQSKQLNSNQHAVMWKALLTQVTEAELRKYVAGGGNLAKLAWTLGAKD